MAPIRLLARLEEREQRRRTLIRAGGALVALFILYLIFTSSNAAPAVEKYDTDATAAPLPAVGVAARTPEEDARAREYLMQMQKAIDDANKPPIIIPDEEATPPLPPPTEVVDALRTPSDSPSTSTPEESLAQPDHTVLAEEPPALVPAGTIGSTIHTSSVKPASGSDADAGTPLSSPPATSSEEAADVPVPASELEDPTSTVDTSIVVPEQVPEPAAAPPDIPPSPDAHVAPTRGRSRPTSRMSARRSNGDEGALNDESVSPRKTPRDTTVAGMHGGERLKFTVNHGGSGKQPAAAAPTKIPAAGIEEEQEEDDDEDEEEDQEEEEDDTFDGDDAVSPPRAWGASDAAAASADLDAYEERAVEQWKRRASETYDFSGSSHPLARNLTVVWDFGACGCTGWSMEATNMVLGLAPYIDRIGIVAGRDCFCEGIPSEDLELLERLRAAPVAQWDIDVWISHKPPPRYPRFPYRGVVRVEREPLYLVGRSMTEVHLVPQLWADRIASMIDEVWLPSDALLPAFTRAGVDARQVALVPEPVDETLYDPLEVAPLELSGLRTCNFLSVFKLEPRKGWKILVRAFMEEFDANDDVTLFLHTYLFNDRDPYNERRIRMRIDEFIETLTFPGRDLVSRPLPMENLHVLSGRTPLDEMPRLYRTFQAFVLPTHGEGWGLPLMEAMAMGLPAIATNWGGQLAFMNEANSYLLPVERFAPAEGTDFEPGARWAVPSRVALRQAMRHVADHPAHTVPVGARARADVVGRFNMRAVAEVILTQLDRIAPIVAARRRDRDAGRTITRGSQIERDLTVHDPSRNDGMRARRGDLQREAADAQRTQDEAFLDQAQRNSLNTAWKPPATRATTPHTKKAASTPKMAKVPVETSYQAPPAVRRTPEKTIVELTDPLARDAEPLEASIQDHQLDLHSPHATPTQAQEPSGHVNTDGPPVPLSAEVHISAHQEEPISHPAQPDPLAGGLEPAGGAGPAPVVETDGSQPAPEVAPPQVADLAPITDSPRDSFDTQVTSPGTYGGVAHAAAHSPTPAAREPEEPSTQPVYDVPTSFTQRAAPAAVRSPHSPTAVTPVSERLVPRTHASRSDRRRSSSSRPSSSLSGQDASAPSASDLANSAASRGPAAALARAARIKRKALREGAGETPPQANPPSRAAQRVRQTQYSKAALRRQRQDAHVQD